MGSARGYLSHDIKHAPIQAGSLFYTSIFCPAKRSLTDTRNWARLYILDQSHVAWRETASVDK
jgi:hypothetical protein